MFTGIVEECGQVASFERAREGRRLTVAVTLVVEDLAIGDSIAVDGCCLTAVEFTREAVAFDLLEESVRRTRFADLRPGDRVNLERSMRLGGKMGGHMVTGHVDAIGRVSALERSSGGDTRLAITHDPAYARLVVEKGSIALNGVSLTVAEVSADGFVVWLIPHTLAVTNLSALRAGDAVNLEFDIVAKHLDKLCAPYLAQVEGLRSNT